MSKIQEGKKQEKELYDIVRKIRMVIFDFDGVFTDNRVLVLQDGTEGVFCYRSDGLGLTALKKEGLALLVLSTEVNPVVSSRCQKLSLPCIQACKNKLEVLKLEAAKLNISLKEIVYVGNDVNDRDCLKEVGLPVCVVDSHPDVLPLAQYVTKMPGGYGAVREICDFIIKVRNG